jgi:hypothetical protein
MIRLIGIALVILGLVAQPLLAAVPDSMVVSGAQSSGLLNTADSDHDMIDHSAMGADQSSQAPCHESSAEEISSAPCENCEVNCADGMCASDCSLSGVALIHQLLVNLDSSSATRVVGITGALVEGLPARIFHPPKHA